MPKIVPRYNKLLQARCAYKCVTAICLVTVWRPVQTAYNSSQIFITSIRWLCPQTFITASCQMLGKHESLISQTQLSRSSS